jgi:osmotically-inducible protein OsmY
MTSDAQSGVDIDTVPLQLPQPSRVRDVDIAGSVRCVLAWTAALPVQAVQVKVEDGWVTLSGGVDWHYQKMAAAVCVRAIRGVRGVHNQIQVRPVAGSGAVAAA